MMEMKAYTYIYPELNTEVWCKKLIVPESIVVFEEYFLGSNVCSFLIQGVPHLHENH